jgi:hypothetical protein
MTDEHLDPEQEHERLDDLGERIARTRRDAEDLVPGEHEERTFADSGEIGRDQDDQTIVPPG